MMREQQFIWIIEENEITNQNHTSASPFDNIRRSYSNFLNLLILEIIVNLQYKNVVNLDNVRTAMFKIRRYTLI